MKKLVFPFIFVFIFLTASASFAGTMMKNNVGCGMGSIWFAEKEGLFFHLLATTSNGYSQTFGISSGTSGCEHFKGIVFNNRMENYVAQNLDNLATDMARGHGEYIQTLSILMEVSDNQREAFYTSMQQNFSRIYTSSDVTAADVVRNISTVVHGS